MTTYLVDQRVVVFMADVQRHVPGFVTAATRSCVLVSLDDRMVPVTVDPADHFAIQPEDIGPHIDAVTRDINDLLNELGPPPGWAPEVAS